jgi:sulfopyruvate decarboxylase alpha subunit
MEQPNTPAQHWADHLFALLKQHEIRQVALVPDAGHARLIRHCLADAAMQVVTLTTEEEGIALLTGAWLGGDKGVLLMQSSGVGNCINMLSLAINHRTPMPMIVTMRGDFGEFNPAQVPMGQATQPVLEAMGTLVNRADSPDDIAACVEATLKFAYNTYRPTATLIGQRVIGAKTFGKD